MKDIEAHVAAFGKPTVTSLANDTHIFHFDRDLWTSNRVLLVNKNGHHFRTILQPDSKWLFCKTWNGLFETQPWMVEANLRREDPAELIRLCGVGPQGKQTFESLCLLPKESTQPRRKVVWRNQILDIQFESGFVGFTLITPPPESGGPGQRKRFDGKVWESQEAARWCLANLTGKPVGMVEAKVATAEQARVDERVMADLEGSELWGIF